MKNAQKSKLALLKNVILFGELMDRLIATPPHIPPLGVFYGFSGYGKTRSSIFTANIHQALYLEVGASWTIKQFCKHLCIELGIVPQSSTTEMVQDIIDVLQHNRKPLIIDEFDHIARLGVRSINIVREILDKASSPIILIGEHMLPTKLKRWERFDNRVRSWVAARPSDNEDTQKLAEFYAPDIEIEGALLEELCNKAGGITRRICIGIESMKEFAYTTGTNTVTVQNWGDKVFFDEHPQR